MAKIMKKGIALVLTIALCAGQVYIPVRAAEAPDPEVTITAVEGGTQTVTITKDPGTNTQTTVTEVNTANPETGTTHSSTTTEVLVETPGGTDLKKETDWSSTTTQEGSEIQTGNPTIETDTNTVTKVEGSEDITNKITNNPTEGTQTITGVIEGQETTVIDGTTVTTTTETDKKVHETTVEDPTDTKELEPGKDKTENGLAPGKESSEAWQDGKINPGKVTGVTEKENGTYDVDVESQKDVTLELTPGMEDYTEKTITITLEDVASLEGKDIVSKTPVTDDNGKTVGWKVVYKEKSNVTDATPKASIITDEGTWKKVGGPVDTYVDPGKYTEGTNTEGDDLETVENGQSVTTIVEKIIKDGKFEGYRITKVTTTKSTADAVDNPLGTRYDGKIPIPTYPDVPGYTPPDEPEESVTDNEYGGKTTVSVEPMMEGDKVKGYTVTTEIRSEDGELIYTETKNLYGTESNTQKSMVVDTEGAYERTVTTTMVTTTEVEEVRTIKTTQEMQKTMERQQTYQTTILNDNDIYQLVDTGDGLYLLYQGKMFQVKTLQGHGGIAMDGLDPQLSLIKNTDPDNNLKDKNPYSEDGLYWSYSSSNPNKTDTSFADGYNFQIVGNGLASELEVNRYNGTWGGITNHQFALRDKKGNTFYAYCADMATDVVVGANYNMEDVENATYYKGTDAAKHLKTVAINGFWGTASGVGSLAAVQQLLKDYGYTEAAKYITEGEALSATQAAIWKFGNTDHNRYVSDTDPVSGSTYADILYTLLTSDALLSATTDTSTDMLDKKDITGATITVKDQVKKNDGTNMTVGGNQVYNTDVTFSLSVTQSDLTGNLKIVVTQGNNNVLREVELATADSNILGKIMSGGKEVGTTIKLENLELVEGVNFTLNLVGTQNLQEGVYLYTAKGGKDAAQTFIGVASGKQDVNLAVDLVFKVEDPEMERVNTTTTTLRDDIQMGTQLWKRTDSAENTLTNTSGEEKTDVSHAIDIYATAITTEIRYDTTKEDREWKAFYEYAYAVVNDEDGYKTTDDEEGKDKANAPKTGDMTFILAAVSGLSLGGMVLLKKKREDEE